MLRYIGYDTRGPQACDRHVLEQPSKCMPDLGKTGSSEKVVGAKVTYPNEVACTRPAEQQT